MQLMTIRADAAEGARGPWLAGGADEKLLFTAFFKQRMIRGGKLEGLGIENGGEAEKQKQPKDGPRLSQPQQPESFRSRPIL
jgi:hypothetical protein